jgi:hypothetical protein
VATPLAPWRSSLLHQGEEARTTVLQGQAASATTRGALLRVAIVATARGGIRSTNHELGQWRRSCICCEWLSVELHMLCGGSAIPRHRSKGWELELQILTAATAKAGCHSCKGWPPELQRRWCGQPGQWCYHRQTMVLPSVGGGAARRVVVLPINGVDALPVRSLTGLFLRMSVMMP